MEDQLTTGKYLSDAQAEIVKNQLGRPSEAPSAEYISSLAGLVDGFVRANKTADLDYEECLKAVNANLATFRSILHYPAPAQSLISLASLSSLFSLLFLVGVVNEDYMKQMSASLMPGGSGSLPSA